jgi:hypothetical protein
MSSAGADSTAELVKLARKLERQLARRRAITRKLAELDAEITTTRRFLRDLTRPFAPGESQIQYDELPCCSPRADDANAPHAPSCPRVQ